VNDFVLVIYNAVKKAHCDYKKISGGYWLWHAPEFFIQVIIAQELSKASYTVFIDTPNKRIRADHPGEGTEISQDDANRPDLTVWHKSKNSELSVKAKIEIKKTYKLKDVKSDVDKLRNNIEFGKATKTGYVVVYTETPVISGKDYNDTLQERFDGWSKNCNVELLERHIDPKTEYDKEKKKKWAWGFCILRIEPLKNGV
jgi:hypothetical protein